MLIDINIRTVMQSGQVFSYEEYNNGYKVFSADKMCLAFPVEKNSGQTKIICIDEEKAYWENYFNAKQGSELEKIFSNASNSFIKQSMQFSTGMTMLKQDLWEMIVSFIVSQRNSIPAIRKILANLRQELGTPKIICLDGTEHTYYTFPTAKELKDLQLQDLQEFSLGYRDKYIFDAICWFNHNNIMWDQLTHNEILDTLQEIHGVGPKVAGCIALFALNDLQCFPVDVWIGRLLEQKLITDDDLKRYKNEAGYLNQIVYYYSIMHREEIAGGVK